MDVPEGYHFLLLIVELIAPIVLRAFCLFFRCSNFFFTGLCSLDTTVICHAVVSGTRFFFTSFVSCVIVSALLFFLKRYLNFV